MIAASRSEHPRRVSCETPAVRIEIEPGVRLFVDVDGTGWTRVENRLEPRPTLLLLHGGPGMDHSGYRDFFGPFRDVAQVVYYDHRGNGRSDHDDQANWTLDTWADDVVRLCDALGVESPVVLGNSFGGMVAMAYAARHPGHPGGLVLSSTAARHDQERIVARFTELGGEAVGAVADRFWADPANADLGEYLTVCGPLYTQREGNLFTDRATVVNPDVLSHWGSGEAQRMDLLDGLAAIRCPTLLLAGRLDPVCPVEGMEAIAARIPDDWADLVVFDTCGHGVFRDAPEQADSVLRSFLGAVSPRTAPA